MGYCIDFVGADFRVKAENKAKAHAAMVAMWEPDRQPMMNGGSRDVRHYAWLNDTALSKGTSESFEQAMGEWRYPVEVDPETGDATLLYFSGEKIGDEDQLWAAIAPFVEPGSYIEMRGEDGAQWRWAFDGDSVAETYGKVVYE